MNLNKACGLMFQQLERLEHLEPLELLEHLNYPSLNLIAPGLWRYNLIREAVHLMKSFELSLQLARPADATSIAKLSRDLIENGLQWRWTPRRVAASIRAP